MVLAWQAVLQVYRAVLDRDDVTPGMIVCIQSFGELAHWHPHIHALVSDGQDSPGSSLAFPTPSQYLPGVPKGGFLSVAELIGSVLFHDPYGAELDHLNEMPLDVISGSNDAPPRNSKERRDKAELESQVARSLQWGGTVDIPID